MGKHGYTVKTADGTLEALPHDWEMRALKECQRLARNGHGWEMRALKECQRLARNGLNRVVFILFLKLALKMSLQITFIIIYRSMTPNRKDLPMAPDIELPWPLSIALFLICVGVSIMTSRWFYKKPTTGIDGEQPDTETEISDSEQPYTAAEISDTRGERSHDRAVRRAEFLFLGLCHWFMTHCRQFHDAWNQAASLLDIHLSKSEVTPIRRKSRCCVLCAAILAGSAGLLQLLPNYIAALGLDPYYAGCGTSYDAYMKLLLNIVFGSAISALLGWKVFSNLLTLPISLVRGIWLFLLDEKDADVRSNLSCLMRDLAVIMPLIIGFPLLFVSQLTESRRVWQPLLGFWLLPQLWITSRTDSSLVQWSFYPIWLCLYLGFFSWFVFSQIEVLNLNIWKTLQELDWPYVWSLLHAEFCIMNVLVTDVLELILRTKKVQ